MRFDRYERIAGHYASMWPLLVPGYVPILNAMLEVVQALPSQPRDMLDLGCGPGCATVAIAQGCDPKGTVTLVDGSPAMLAAARQLLGEHVREAVLGDFTSADIARQVLPPDAYDAALCSFALHHVEHDVKLAVLEQLGRSVKQGGVLLLADEVAVDRPAGWPMVEQIRGRIIREHLSAGRIHQTFWDLETSLPAEAHLPFLPARVEDLTSWMARAGFACTCPVSVLGSALMVGIRVPCVAG